MFFTLTLVLMYSLIGIFFATLFWLGTKYPNGHSIFRSKKNKVAFAIGEIPQVMGENSDNLLCKLDNQLKTHFKSKGHLHFHVFTPSGEYYIQFRFIGYSTYETNSIESCRLNVLPYIKAPHFSMDCVKD